VPPLQIWPTRHWLLQLPQLSSSLARSTHLPEQLVRPDWQFSAQEPEVHLFPLAQLPPQVPQLSSSLVMSTQTPTHSICPSKHCSVVPESSGITTTVLVAYEKAPKNQISTVSIVVGTHIGHLELIIVVSSS
jgi:hypothetical protein